MEFFIQNTHFDGSMYICPHKSLSYRYWTQWALKPFKSQLASQQNSSLHNSLHTFRHYGCTSNNCGPFRCRVHQSLQEGYYPQPQRQERGEGRARSRAQGGGQAGGSADCGVQQERQDRGPSGDGASFERRRSCTMSSWMIFMLTRFTHKMR